VPWSGWRSGRLRGAGRVVEGGVILSLKSYAAADDAGDDGDRMAEDVV
jgi:hypothetical protein